MSLPRNYPLNPELLPMNKNVSFTCAAAVLLLTTLPATAAPPANSWYIAPEVVYMWTDRDRLADDELGGMFAIGRSFDKWDLELSVSQVSPDAIGNSSLDINSYFANAHRVFYRDSRISPFLKIGAGYVVGDYGGGALSGESFKSWTLAYGLGLLANLAQDDSRGTALALRAEIYGLVSSATSPPYGDHLSDTVAGLGLQYHWGAPVAAAPVAAATAAPVAAAAPEDSFFLPGVGARAPAGPQMELVDDEDDVIAPSNAAPIAPARLGPLPKVDIASILRGYVVFADRGDLVFGRPYGKRVIDEHRYAGDRRDAAFRGFLQDKIQEGFVPRTDLVGDIPAGAEPKPLDPADLQRAWDTLS